MFGTEICNVSYDLKKTMTLNDALRNTNMKEEIVEGMSIFADFIVIKRNIT